MSKLPPLPDFDVAEVAFNVEAVRGYLFTAAMHVAESMAEQNVAHSGAAVMTASVEFAAQVFMQGALRAGVPRQKARQTAEKEFRFYLIKHMHDEPGEQAKSS